MRLSAWFPAVLVILTSASLAGVLAQRSDVFLASRDHPSILYTSRPVDDLVARLNGRIQDGSVTLSFDGENGYLKSVLEALHVPIESQVAVYTQASFQGSLITPTNPRAIFFADSVAVGWVRGGTVLEVAAQDPRQGVVFYELEQDATARPKFTRSEDCLTCHLTWDTLGVPGLFTLSTTSQAKPDDRTSYAAGFVSDHRSSFDQRWGGWFLTGTVGPFRHLGRVVASLDTQFDTRGFPSAGSDVVALMVLEHQTRMTNLITRLGWEARISDSSDAGVRVREAARDLVDYLLFVDEAPLAGRSIRGSSAFAEAFESAGPRDQKGRSLRQFDLARRLMRYPCSFMIYTEAFNALPSSASEAVYRRLWEVLSGAERGARYATLSRADRQAVVEILRDTHKGLPAYFQPVTR